MSAKPKSIIIPLIVAVVAYFILLFLGTAAKFDSQITSQDSLRVGIFSSIIAGIIFYATSQNLKSAVLVILASLVITIIIGFVLFGAMPF